jgi:hypothetical protein
MQVDTTQILTASLPFFHLTIAGDKVIGCVKGEIGCERCVFYKVCVLDKEKI